LRRLIAISAVSISAALSYAGLAKSPDEGSAPQPVYTSVKTSDCRNPPASLSQSFDGRGLTAQQCRGIDGWTVFAVSSDERSWLELDRGGQLWTTEDQVVYQNDFGNFPNLGADKIEWRVRRGVPYAVIFRIAAQDQSRLGPSGAPTISRLFVVQLAADGPRFCGIAKTNDEARKLADAAAACSTALPRR
jgi:hypothetical protein